MTSSRWWAIASSRACGLLRRGSFGRASDRSSPVDGDAPRDIAASVTVLAGSEASNAVCASVGRIALDRSALDAVG
jgi:hypothetical protein